MAGKNEKGWSPYLAGALTGLLMVLSAWLTGRFFGASTTFVVTAGMLQSLVTPERVAAMPVFAQAGTEIDWQWMFVVGILLGSFLSAVLFKDFQWQAVPPMWAARFGPNPVKRGVVAFAGGVVAMFGARLAHGCPSGHGLTGLVHLSISGFVALACFFAGGLVVARLLYGGK